MATAPSLHPAVLPQDQEITENSQDTHTDVNMQQPGTGVRLGRHKVALHSPAQQVASSRQW